MGCDIHLVLERRANGKWITVNTLDHIESRNGFATPLAKERNYERFAKLAGVRGRGPEPRGMPDDASETARLLCDDWGGDGHSHSWLPMKDAARVFLETEYTPVEAESLAAKYPCYHYFGVDDDEHQDEYRVVFWFDN